MADVLYGSVYARGHSGNAFQMNVSTFTEDPDWIQDAAVPLSGERHAGEEVAIYASGPISQLVLGTHQQSYTAHVILYAMCIVGPDEMFHCT